jgi:hypothetical protein
MQQFRDQPCSSFTAEIVSRYGLPDTVHISMKNAKTLIITVAGSEEMDNLLNEHLAGMVQAGIDWDCPFIDVVRLDDHRRPLRLRTDSCRLLLDEIS